LVFRSDGSAVLLSVLAAIPMVALSDSDDTILMLLKYYLHISGINYLYLIELYITVGRA
jgi:hypothetical protein